MLELNVVLNTAPFNAATDCAVKPVPVTWIENTPIGNGEVLIDWMVGAAWGANSVTLAVPR